jgi:hypothetical protein
MNYLIKTQSGNMYSYYTTKDLSKYIGSSTHISIGDESFTILQVLEEYTPSKRYIGNEPYVVTEP